MFRRKLLEYKGDSLRCSLDLGGGDRPLIVPNAPPLSSSLNLFSSFTSPCLLRYALPVIRDTYDTDPREQLISAASSNLLWLMWDLRKLASETFEPLGLTLVQSALLTYIARGATQPKTLAELLGIHPTAVSALLLRLEKLALIERNTLPEDKRYVDVALTPAGAEHIDKLKLRWKEANGVNLSDLSEDGLQHLIELCGKLRRSSETK